MSTVSINLYNGISFSKNSTVSAMSQDIKVVSQIGEGSFGVVMLVKRGERNYTCAMKVFKNDEVRALIS